MVNNPKNSVGVNADIEGVYYKVEVSDEFFALIQEDSWEKTRKFSLNNPLITVNYAERHNIYFYPKGRAVIYDKYFVYH